MTQRDTKFKDVDKSSVASGYIASAVEEGIISGFLDNTYRPNEPVTRAQMAIFVS
ncbi:S-layer homology domain-containing protein [Metabacillus litoralis]|uniref:S-layer homology domain-containing protein n=1 Tax=Metabacillus litoralis TaxID=152268 RepID=A0A5C6V922_9BACI|nr:S-layer homology domain-containing protein [Metabacillus litoralis]